MFDGKAFGQEVVAAVKAHVDKSMAPLLARMTEIERRLDAMPRPKDVDPVEVAEVVLRQVSETFAEIRADIDAIKPDVEIFGQIATAAAKSIAELPQPKDGKDADLAEVKAMIAEAIAAIPPSQAGKDADPAETAAMVASEVERALAALPKPQDGKDGQDGAPGDRGEKGDPGADGKDGRDGCDVVDAMIDKDGCLVVAFSNGRLKNLGQVNGRDGAPGKDGTDGVGFDDLDLVETDEGLMLRFTRGDVVKEFRLPIVTDRGVWKEGTYRKGDGVTWGGSFWIAQDETMDKPDAGKGWRLAVKKGRDGKDAKSAEPTDPKPIKFR